MKSLFFLYWVTILSVLLTPLHNAFPATPGPPVSLETLQARIKEVEATADLDSETRAKLTEWYRKAISYLEMANANQAATRAFQTTKQTASAEAERIRQQIERQEKAAAVDNLPVSDQTPVVEVEQLLVKEKANHAVAEAKLREVEEQLTLQVNRPVAVRQELSEAATRQQALNAELKLPPPASTSALLVEARAWALQSEGLALSTAIRKLDEELLSQPMRVEQLKAQRDQLALTLERIEARTQRLATIVGARQQSEAAQARAETEQAKREAANKHPLVQRLAEHNSVLSQDFASVAAELERIGDTKTIASKEGKQIEEDFHRVEQMVELAGLSQVLGQALLKQRHALPNPSVFRHRAEALEHDIANASLLQLQHEEEQRALRNIADYVEQLASSQPGEIADSIRSELTRLAERRRELLDRVLDLDRTLVRALGELDVEYRHLMTTAEAYDEFLAKHLLWIRSSSAPTLSMFGAIPQQAAELLSPANWRDMGRILAAQLTRQPAFVLGLMLAIVLLLKARALHRALRACGEKTGRIRTDRFVFTFQALLLSLLLAAPLPLVLALTGWQLAASLEATVFTKALSRGFIWVARASFYLMMFRAMCTSGGLAAAHFRWPEASLATLRRGLTRLMLIFLPAAFLALLVITYDIPAMGGGLGRLAIAVVMIALAVFFYCLFEPNQGPLRPFLAAHPTSLLARLRYLWLVLTVSVPLGLAGLAVMGYLYTAGTLSGRLIDTLWFILSLVVIHQLVIRWLMLTRRRIAFRAAVERRQAARAAEETQDVEQPGVERAVFEIEEPEVDLVALSEDSRKLLNTALAGMGLIGIWMIWSRVLPAFGLLDDITLWDYLAVVAGEEKRLPITLADAARAVIIVVFTIVAAKRFPAILEIALLHRLNMTPGGRYTATTLSSYAIVAIGTILAFNTIGASWSQVQWLVAALGVGIGFGLQEIVANFISGLIILFERPIRVGDIVTVGDTDGVVTRIRIRATTIRNWDYKELLVPNKEFITSRVLNWSLSDQTTRIIIPVGLAYGSDVQKAMALMAKAAEENKHVLAEPAPFATFEGFGDNALALNLRCYLPSVDYRLTTITELHAAINQKFNDAGLRIAFPQRDLHLDASQPLDIRIQSDGV